jgi:hypothetical protein
MLAGTEEAIRARDIRLDSAKVSMVPAPQKSSASASVPAALRALLSGLIDYAGMFPPAKLSLEEAAKNFIRYMSGRHTWMLGKFVVPAAKLEELRTYLAGNPEARRPTLSLSVLLGAEPLREAQRIREAQDLAVAAVSPLFSIDSVELRPGSPAMVAELAAILPKGLPVFCEVASGQDLTRWLTALKQAGWFAKIRTGGISREAFPSSSEVAEFLVQCKTHGVAFKATAGLHHPVRSEHPLTYDVNSSRGIMHGFINVFLGAALLECGISKDQLVAVLDDTDAHHFSFSGDFAHWGKLFVNQDDVAGTRRHFAMSFGSCSFEEPIQDIQKLSLL